MSLSARRAWIEMTFKPIRLSFDFASLSARRAWIEMLAEGIANSLDLLVALRKESVDRNSITASRTRSFDSRSPQGERG